MVYWMIDSLITVSRMCVLIFSIVLLSSCDLFQDIKGNILIFYTGVGSVSSATVRCQTDVQSVSTEKLEMIGSINRAGDRAKTAYLGNGMFKNGNGLPVNYNEVPNSTWEINDYHYKYLLDLSIGYQTPGSIHCGNSLVKTIIEDSLFFIHQDGVRNGVLGIKRIYGPEYNSSNQIVGPGVYGMHNNPELPHSNLGNWWHWEIGVPVMLGPILVLMEGEIDETVFKHALNGFQHIMGSDLPPRREGANKMWHARTNLYLSALQNDEARLKKVKEALESELITKPFIPHHSGTDFGNPEEDDPDGIKEDFSFHQHDTQIYNRSYGSSFQVDVANFLFWLNKTPYMPGQSFIDLFSNFSWKGSSSMIFKNYHDPSVLGRTISRGNFEAMKIPPWIIALTSLPNVNQSNFASLLLSFQETNPKVSQIGYLGPLEQIKTFIEENNIQKIHRKTSRHFFQSDYTVHMNPNFFVSYKMLSLRTKLGELLNGEGKSSWHRASGVYFLSLLGGEYITANVPASMNYHRLPGMTDLQFNEGDLDYGQNYRDQDGYGIHSFVGGVSDGSIAYNAMSWRSPHSDVTAKKSALFTDQGLIFLGSGIRSVSDQEVTTVINQRPRLQEGSVISTSLGDFSQPTGEIPSARWFLDENIGYYIFSEPNKVRAYTNEQTGSWKKHRDSASSDLFSHKYFNLDIHHGLNPNNATFSYGIFPNVNKESMNKFSQNPDVEILRNTTLNHAILQRRSGGNTALAGVYWNYSDLNLNEFKLLTDTPIVFLKNSITSESRINLVIASPERSYDRIEILLPENLSFQGTYNFAEITSLPNGTKIIFKNIDRGFNYLVKFNIVAHEKGRNN